MSPRGSRVPIAVIAILGAVFTSGQSSRAADRRTKHLTAPTYYIAISAKYWDQITIRFRGASNLPSGSGISVRVAEMDHDGWKQYSDVVCIPVDKQGFFK